MQHRTYLYRSTEDKLEEHYERIAEAGDTVLHTIFKGGRDYVIVAQVGGPIPIRVVVDGIGDSAMRELMGLAKAAGRQLANVLGKEADQ